MQLVFESFFERRATPSGAFFPLYSQLLREISLRPGSGNRTSWERPPALAGSPLAQSPPPAGPFQPLSRPPFLPLIGVVSFTQCALANNFTSAHDCIASRNNSR